MPGVFDGASGVAPAGGEIAVTPPV
jgi:hypothetical protein